MSDTDFLVSATQVSTFELCHRKWAIRYIDGVKAPPNKFAELGIDTHGHLERWLREGLVPASPDPHDKSALLAQALIPHLPPPQAVDPNHVEMDQLYGICGVKFMLKTDLFMPKGWAPIPWVFDHKTSGDLKWALTAERMPQDIQASLYGAWALHLTGESEVGLQWNYVRTKGAIKTEPVKAVVSGRSIQERLGKTLDSARHMRVIAESGCAGKDVEYDAAGCVAFGGCPYQEICNLSPQERMRSIMSQATPPGMSQDPAAFFASLAGNGAVVNPPATPQAPPALLSQFAQPAQAPQQVLTPQQLVQAPVPQQAPVLAPQQAPVLAPQQPPAQMPLLGVPAEQPAPKAGPGRPPKGKDKDEAWVQFANTALSALVTMRASPEQAAEMAAQYANAMLKRFEERKG